MWQIVVVEQNSSMTHNEIGLAEGGALKAPTRQASTKLNRMNNTSNMHFAPAFGKPMLTAGGFTKQNFNHG